MTPRLNVLFLATTLGLACLAPARAEVRRADRWDPVSAQELAHAKPVVQQDADAEAIFCRVWLEDDPGLQIRDYYVRVKLFTDRGAERYRKIDITYIPLRVEISGFSARTILPDGTVVPADPGSVADEVIRSEKAGDPVRQKSIAPQRLGPGCIVEYRYHEERKGLGMHNLMLKLQEDIPVQSLSYYIRPQGEPGTRLRLVKYRSTASISRASHARYYEISDSLVPAYDPEPYAPPEYEQRAWMLLEYTREKLTSPEAFWRKTSREAANWFQSFTVPDRATRALAEKITQGAKTDAQRARRLAEWMQREFRLVSREHPDTLRAAGLKENTDGASAARQKGGAEAYASLAFAALARSLGIETRLVRVPTRQEIFFDQSMMNEAFLPGVQVALRLEGGWQCFAPAARDLPWDMVPWDQEAQMGLFCDRDSARFAETPAAGPLRSKMARSASLALLEDGTLEGDMTLTLTGHLNHRYRPSIEDVSADEVVRTLRRVMRLHAGGVELSDVRVQAGPDRHEGLEVRCRIRFPQMASVSGKRLILEPSGVHALTPAFFTASQRRSPVYFPYSWSEFDTLHIRLPERWKAEALDHPGAISAPGVLRYDAKMTMNGDRELVYMRELEVGEGGPVLVAVQGYADAKKVFDHVNARDRATATFVRSGGGP